MNCMTANANMVPTSAYPSVLPSGNATAEMKAMTAVAVTMTFKPIASILRSFRIACSSFSSLLYLRMRYACSVKNTMVNMMTMH